MKKIIVLFSVFLGLSLPVFSQSKAELISLCVYLPTNMDIPEAALQYLENKLETFATSNGNTNFLLCDRFILTAKIDVLNKDIIAGPPQKISQTLSITLQIGDVQEHKLFASTNLTAIGTGTNLTKSYMEAFKTLNKNDKQIVEFLEKGKGKVITYYQQQCEPICQTATLLANSHQYDEALYKLAVLPDLGNECSEKVQDLMANIAMQKINTDGLNLLNQAKLSWTKEQNENGAVSAVSFLCQIHPLADCYPEVEKLTHEISSKLEADEGQRWQFQLKQYNDRVRTERLKMQNEKEVSKMQIAAARDTAVAFAENQPQQQIILW